jgi:hypothetical protein
MALIPDQSDSAVKSMVGATSPSVSLGELMAQRTASLKPYKEDVEAKTKKASEFDAEKEVFKQKQTMREAGEKYAAMTAAQQKAEKAYEPVEDLEEDMLNAKFVPTQESAKDLAALYGLIGVVGWAIGSGGKGNAMRAMSAQNGMLEGYQKGRADLYKKEKDLFEASIKALREKSKIVADKARRVAELAAKDPQAAAELSRYVSGQEGAEFYLQNADKFGYANAAKSAEEAFKAADKIYFEIVKEHARAAKRTGKPQQMKGSDGKLYFVYSEDDVRPVQAPEGVTLTKPTVEKTAKGKGTGGASGAGGAVPKDKETNNEHRFRFSAIQNVRDVIDELKKPEVRRLIGPQNQFTPDVILNLQTGFPELAQKLARFQSEEFKIGGKALTASEQKILGPIYNWRGLTAKSLEDNLKEAERAMDKEQVYLENRYPGLAQFDYGATPKSKYSIGQIIEKGGKKYEVTDISNPNDPDIREVK